MYSLLLSLSLMGNAAKENATEEIERFKNQLNMSRWQITFIYQNAYQDRRAYENLIEEYKLYGFIVPQHIKDELDEVNRILAGWSNLDNVYATRYKSYSDLYRLYFLNNAKEYFHRELAEGKPLPMPVMPIMWESYSYISVTIAVQHSLLPQ